MDPLTHALSPCVGVVRMLCNFMESNLYTLCRGVAGKASSSTAGGLTNAVLYAEGSKVMLTANLWKEAGTVVPEDFKWNRTTIQ